jgi:hypothetical protein
VDYARLGGDSCATRYEISTKLHVVLIAVNLVAGPVLAMFGPSIKICHRTPHWGRSGHGASESLCKLFSANWMGIPQNLNSSLERPTSPTNHGESLNSCALGANAGVHYLGCQGRWLGKSLGIGRRYSCLPFLKQFFSTKSSGGDGINTKLVQYSSRQLFF